MFFLLCIIQAIFLLSSANTNFIYSMRLFHFVFQIVKTASQQSVETLGDPVVIFPLFTRGQFTGDAPLKMQSRNGVLLLKCLILTKDGATVLGERN